MLEFKDFHDRLVTLDFDSSPEARHVLAICRFNGKYLMTHHQVRGIEFPGGKVDGHESLQEAVHREVFEETGGSIEDLKCIGSYTVHGPQPFTKAVYFVKIKDLFFKCEYMETYGPVLYGTAGDVPDEERSLLLEDACIRYLYDLSKKHEFFE
ncbi:NUDIX domain-containing protein [Salinicoccus albus]|uniref:NUDIX domain-containing protein n=1 Tax=Salinicoccus albus TaxID=418756 RepID=UPI00036CA32F|nr:NUDIX domain-containing protein [Salinicoccus albus]